MHKFRNETGAEVPKYGVFKIGDPVITPTDNLNQWLRIQSFEGLTPTADCDFAITQEAYKSTADALKPCVVDGTTPVTIDVTDETHTHAKAGTTVDKLVSASSGPAKIVWKESGTGDKKALIQLGIGGGESLPIAKIEIGPQTVGQEFNRDTYFNKSNFDVNRYRRIPLLIRDCAPFARENYTIHGPAGTAVNDTFGNNRITPDFPTVIQSVNNDQTGLILKKAGTYKGVLSIAYELLQHGSTTNYLHQSSTASTQSVTVDKSDGSGTASVIVNDFLTSPMHVVTLDRINVVFNLVATPIGNEDGSQFGLVYSSIAQYRFERRGEKSLQDSGANGIQEEDEFTIPFIFSVDDSSFEGGTFEPFELQLWGHDYNAASSYASTSTALKIFQTSNASQKTSCWIEYHSEMMSAKDPISVHQGGVTPITN